MMVHLERKLLYENINIYFLQVGVAGPVGAAFTVYERNWKCPKCKTENLAIHNTCSQCSTEKPKDSSTIVMDGAMKNLLV